MSGTDILVLAAGVIGGYYVVAHYMKTRKVV